MAWLSQHRAALARALHRLVDTPLNTVLSLLVMGIALTLPAFGWVVLDNLRDLGRSASGTQQISLFMTLDASRKDSSDIEARLQKSRPGHWRFVPREDALKHLQSGEGMADVIASLPRNPLPDAFIITPHEDTPVASLETLREDMARWPKVAHVQLDAAWVKRFDAFLRLGRLMLTMLAVVFSAGLVAVTFNTIRLQVLAHSAEIEVSRLIGATDAFIQRPFVYFGTLQGALGGLLATGLVAIALHLLEAPVAELAALYGGQFLLTPPGLREAGALAACGGLLGWLGAQLSTYLSLRGLD